MSSLQYLPSQWHVFASSSSSYSTGEGVLGAIILVLIIASFWKIFKKAGQPGWAAIIPIYNILVELRVAKRPWWWLLLLIIPVVNFFVGIFIAHDLAKAFGKGVGYTLLLIFLPFIGYPMLAFSDAKYQPSVLVR